MRFLILALLPFLFLLSACAVIPLSKGISARNLLQGKWEADSQFTLYRDKSGANLFIPSFRGIYGLRDWVNLGVHTEFQTLSLFSRFQMVSPETETGFSAASVLGTVLFTGNFSFFGGAIAGYRWGDLEPYLGIYYHFAGIDKTRLDIAFFDEPPELSAQFAAANLGFKYWVSSDVAAGLEWAYVNNGIGIQFPVHHFLNFQASLIF